MDRVAACYAVVLEWAPGTRDSMLSGSHDTDFCLAIVATVGGGSVGWGVWGLEDLRLDWNKPFQAEFLKGSRKVCVRFWGA